MSLSHFAVLLKPSFAFATARTIRADTCVEHDGDHIFRREGEDVFRVPSRYIQTVSEHPTHKEALEHVRDLREARAGAGAASAHITETGVAPRTHPKASHQTARGPAAEGLSVRVRE